MQDTEPLEDHHCIVQSRRLPSGEIDDELMALDARRGEILGLDKVGTAIWRMARDPVTIAAILARLAQEYDATPVQLRADVLPFLEELRASGLIETVA